jgi:hypothetical protein
MMRQIHERITDVAERPATRRGVVRGAAMVGGGAMAMAASPLVSQYRALAQNETGDDIISVLNYALTLEHLENQFYAAGLATFTSADIEALGFLPGVFDFIAEIGANEAAHVETLTTVINDLGGEPVEAGEYAIEDALASADAFIATAQALENTGVGAYTGAAKFLIENDELLTAALTIHAVEARHAAYLNILNGESPFPDAFDEPLTPAEVVEIASDFIVEAEVVTPEAAAAEDDEEETEGADDSEDEDEVEDEDEEQDEDESA